MPRGGFRPGAGRPKKGEVRPPRVKPGSAGAGTTAPAVVDDVAVQAAVLCLTPLDYMLQVMRDEDEDPARRDRMAMAAAPFVHTRAADSRPGKKEQQAKTAQTAAAGRFGSRPAPLKVVGGRSA